MPAPIRLGTQGWNYDAWAGPFYPEGTKAVDFLTVYSRAFDTVEVDSTFYATPPSKTIRGWAQRTPPGFLFSLKLPQEITHERKLRGADDLAKEFFDRARELEDKLGVSIPDEDARSVRTVGDIIERIRRLQGTAPAGP